MSRLVNFWRKRDKPDETGKPCPICEQLREWGEKPCAPPVVAPVDLPPQGSL